MTPSAARIAVTGPAPAVRCQGLTKRFLGRPAVDQVSFEVKPGQLVKVEGANGAGKTTLLRLLAGVARPSQGSAAICGWDVVRDALDARERVTYQPVLDALHDELTPLENLHFARSWQGRPAAREEITRALEEVGFPVGRQRPCRQYSTGQRKRVALARTLLLASDVLLLDEPHAHLDAEGRALVTGLLSRWRDQGRTVIYAAPVAIEGKADRVLVLTSGRLTEGTAAPR